MFALVKAGQVIKELNGGSPYTDEAGTQYPANIFSVWSTEDVRVVYASSGFYSEWTAGWTTGQRNTTKESVKVSLTLCLE